MPACHDIAMGPGDWMDGQRQAAQAAEATSGHAPGQDGQRPTTSPRDHEGGKSNQDPPEDKPSRSDERRPPTVALGRASTPAVLEGPSLPLDGEKATLAADGATCTTTGTDRAQDAQPRPNQAMEGITAVPATRSADQQGTTR
ncbi:hypothetical protein QE152_g22248 [Popillia japonica]|uniref:Uncharacterized protein n=1 Tax=Popillia japonica TaxID=7064 RepID=A0AAW1KJ99_POPJA